MSTPHSDAPLLALASDLEAAATPYLAYDRDAEAHPRDPDYAEAIDTARTLYGAVEAVAERIFAHEPRTLPGLLLTAHAAAITAEDAWDEQPDHGGKDGRLLRLVCNGLFRLAGVNWRGRPVPGALPPADLGPEPALAAMVAEWQAMRDGIEGAAYNDEALTDRKFELQQRILTHPCASLADLVAKLPLFREELDAAGPPVDDGDQDGGDIQLAAWRGLTRDLEGLAGGPVSRPPELATEAAPAADSLPVTVSLPDAVLIPLAEAAIAEARAADAIAEASHDTPPGTFARSLQLLELVTATDPLTPAGLAAKARVLLTHMPEVDDTAYDWRCEALALSIARDAARLGASPSSAPAAEPLRHAAE